MQWLSGNIGSIAVSALVILAVFLAVKKLIKDKKAGKSILECEGRVCSGNCASCSGKGSVSVRRKEER